MSMGQGATMALPIWAIFMKKVYSDPSLGFSPMVKFDIPLDYDSCESQSQDEFGADGIEEVFE